MISIRDVIEFYKMTNPDRSESTYSVMKFNIVRLEKITKLDINDLTIKDFENINETIKKFSHYALNTQIQTVMGIKTFLKFKRAKENLIDKWNIELKSLCDETKIIIEKNIMTPKEEKNWIDYPILKEKIKYFFENEFFQELEKENLTDYTKYKWIRDFLLLCLYTELPPTRIGNYQFMKIRYEKKRLATSLDKKQNYLMINKDDSYELVFNKYKTSKYLGQIDHVIKKNNILSKIIPKFLEIRSKYVKNKKNLTLFVNKINNDMTQTNITDTLKFITRKIVDKELSVNLLRHIFVSDFLTHNHSIEHKKEIAFFMGQTYEATMMEKYNKKKPQKETQSETIDKVKPEEIVYNPNIPNIEPHYHYTTNPKNEKMILTFE